MQKSWTHALLALSLSWAAAQVQAQAAPATGPAGPTLAAGTVIGAELSKSVDAKKAKVGQEVVAKSLGDQRDTSGNVVIPRGAKLIGHVTEVKAASKQEPQSTLGIIFDKVEAKHGKESKEIAMHAGIQALARPQPSPAMQEQEEGPMGGPGAPGGAGGGPMGGSPSMGPGGGGSMGAPPSAQTGDMGGGNMGGPPSQPRAGGPVINANSHGVIGIPNLTLSPEASATQGSVLTSSHGNVKLEGGTLMVLRVISQ